MANELKNAADAILNQTITGSPRVPGVVAMATDRRATSTRVPRASVCSARTRT